LGVIVGGAASGVQIGLAPDAQWIAARIFNDRGHATTAAIHAALRWALDPDGDPTTPDAPQVLNASWSAVDLTCNPEFAADLRALREAGILPIFAAGTQYPVSPANLPEAFAVGALAEADTLFNDSASGPSACPEKFSFPDIVAPGAHIFTTDRSGLYTTLDGTSLAAAHVSGALALLLSARPGLTADEQAALLRETAVDLGAPGPDAKFGYGRLNVNAAFLQAMQPPPAVMALRLMLALAGSLLLLWWAAWRARTQPRLTPNLKSQFGQRGQP
jgi:subtilisin family serine protease